MICYHKKIDKKDIGGGIIWQVLGRGENMNVFHWDMQHDSKVQLHNHKEEQFGYVIKGGFDVVIGDERFFLEAGDAYFIPPDVPHAFTAVGDTEAIDVFFPIRNVVL